MFEKSKTIPGTHTLKIKKSDNVQKSPLKASGKPEKLLLQTTLKMKKKKVTPWKQNIKKRRLLDSTVGMGESVLTPALVIQLD